MNKKIKNGCPLCGGDLKKGIYCEGFHCNKCDYDVHPVNYSCAECKKKEQKLKEIKDYIDSKDSYIQQNAELYTKGEIFVQFMIFGKIKKILEEK